MKQYVLGLLLLVGCRHDTDENLGLSRGAPEVPELTGLQAPGRLEAVLAASATAVERRLGPHVRQQRLSLALHMGEQSDHFEEVWRTEVEGHGVVHAVHETDRDQGVEWYAQDDRLWVRLRHGRFVERRPQGDEVARLHDQQAGPLAGYLAVLGRFASRQAHPALLGTRNVWRVGLLLEPNPESLGDDEPAHAWRDTLRVSRLDGEVMIDAASAALLSARLDVAYSLTRPARGQARPRDIAVELRYRSDTRLGPIAPLTPPSDAVKGDGPAAAGRADSLVRARPLLDRAALLDGLVAKRR